MRLSGSWFAFARQFVGSGADCDLYLAKILLKDLNGFNFGQLFCLVDSFMVAAPQFVQSFARMTPGAGDQGQDFTSTN